MLAIPDPRTPNTLVELVRLFRVAKDEDKARLQAAMEVATHVAQDYPALVPDPLLPGSLQKIEALLQEHKEGVEHDYLLAARRVAWVQGYAVMEPEDATTEEVPLKTFNRDSLKR